MRKLSLVVAAVVALGLALAPTASADLVSAVQQQLSQSGGRLPTDLAAQQTFVSGLVSSGAVPQSQQSSTLSALQAIVTTSPSLNDPTQVANLLSLVGTQPTTAYDQFLQGFSIPSGQTPTGTSLAPLSAQLRALAATSGVPPEAVSVLNGLADQIDAAGSGELGSGLLEQLRGALAAVGALTPEGLGALNKLLGALVPFAPASTGSSSPAPAPAAPAPVAVPVVTPFNLVLKVAKVKVASTRKSANVTLRSAAPTALVPVGFAVTLGHKAAAKPVLFNLASGRNVTKKVTFTRSIAKSLKKKGGTLKVTPAFNVPGLASVPGITLAETAKSVKVRKPHARKHRS